MDKIIREINTFYRVLGTECPKYKNIRVTESDLKNEHILSEVLYDIEDNVYVYEGAEELCHDIRHYTNTRKYIYNAVKVLGITLIIAGVLLILGTAGESDLNGMPFAQIISQITMGAGISTLGFIATKIIKKLED